MSVTCERPLDGVSAAQKLNSQSFDLVLVDCENLPAAKLIFDVCRRGKNGNNPVPIAIVDGRAGLPTAFRLGAELILTKPVAKDQARGTIRTAVSRVRKTAPANESATANALSAAPASTLSSKNLPEEHTQAAAAAAVSSQLTSFDEPAPSFVSSSLPSAAPATAAAVVSTATLAAPALTTKMNSAVDDIDAPPTTPESTPTASVDSKYTPPVVPSDDPVLAELERMELEESQRAEAQKPDSQKQSTGLDKAAPEQGATKSDVLFSSYPQESRKTRAPLVAILMLAVAGGGFYAAWTYQPGFRAIVQPQIDRVLGFVGMAATPAPSPAKPSAQLAPAQAPTPAPPSPTDPNQAPATAADSGINSAADPTNGSATTSAAAAVSGKPPVASTAVATPASAATTTAITSKPEAGKPGDIAPADNKSKNDSAATSSSAPLPGENTAVILSSKGAENRLVHSTPPKYPAEARSEGTVLLKAVVDETGKVEGLRLIEGNGTLASAAMQAVKQWRYRPYARDGKTQPFQTVVIVDFQKP